MTGEVNTAFVLGGGGRWGAVEVGMLKALDEAGIRPDIVLGTSVGAFNGSVIADQPGPAGVDRLLGLWHRLSGTDLFKSGMLDRVRNLITLQPGLYSSAQLRTILQEVHSPGRRIEDIQIPFQCVAASIERSAEHWFVDGPLIDALLATSAVPALFHPVRVGEEHFYDGGLVASVPLARAVSLGARVIYVMQVGRIESPLRPPRRLYETALISFEIARRHTFATALADLPDQVELHLLPSGNPVAFNDRRQLRWKDTGETEVLVEGAYLASREYLEREAAG